jgi:hypothetical protein
MARLEVRVCDICKVEYRSDKVRHWSDGVDKIIFDFKSHAGIQGGAEIDVCTGCGKKILAVVEKTIAELKEGVEK